MVEPELFELLLELEELPEELEPAEPFEVGFVVWIVGVFRVVGFDVVEAGAVTEEVELGAVVKVDGAFEGAEWVAWWVTR